MKYIIIFYLFFLPTSTHAVEIDWNPKVFSITDGDTLKRNGKRYRLEGIDAPEINQNCSLNNKNWECGLAATLYLRKLHGKDGFECKDNGQDRYKRILARCYILADGDRIDIGSLMVKAGYALAYRQYSKNYINDEILAKENKKGLWGSQFVKPWEFRSMTKKNNK
ncbi:thermonuclease family protein [Hyphomicrobiales bacterium]|nr:thermonuclease family protein [Hyphomicrobiales bacterium]